MCNVTYMAEPLGREQAVPATERGRPQPRRKAQRRLNLVLTTGIIRRPAMMGALFRGGQSRRRRRRRRHSRFVGPAHRLDCGHRPLLRHLGGPLHLVPLGFLLELQLDSAVLDRVDLVSLLKGKRVGVPKQVEQQPKAKVDADNVENHARSKGQALPGGAGDAADGFVRNRLRLCLWFGTGIWIGVGGFFVGLRSRCRCRCRRCHWRGFDFFLGCGLLDKEAAAAVTPAAVTPAAVTPSAAAASRWAGRQLGGLRGKGIGNGRR